MSCPNDSTTFLLTLTQSLWRASRQVLSNLIPAGPRVAPLRSGGALLALVVAAPLASADVELAPMFQDHMVLQQGDSVPVFGTANPGDFIIVNFGGVFRPTFADPDGFWRVDLGPLAANDTPNFLSVQGTNQVVLTDVLVGEVWLASGQSNMEWPLDRVEDAKQVLAVANRPNIRLCSFNALRRVGNHVNAEQLDRIRNADFFDWEWQRSSQVAAEDFSGVAWFFARDIQEARDVPVGIIDMAFAGSEIEAWISREALIRDPATRALGELGLLDWIDSPLSGPYVRNAARNDLNRWFQDAIDEQAPPPLRHFFEPGYLYEAGVQRLIGMRLKGVIWYQGESNSHNAPLYKELFRVMVSSWRKSLGEPRLPFLTTQLTGYGFGFDWPGLREVQRQIDEEMPLVSMAVTIDVGDEASIHPERKRQVGERLANLALHEVYLVKERASEGPKPSGSAQLEPLGTVRVRFKDAKGLRLREGEDFGGFVLVAPGGAPAAPVDGWIEGNDVVLVAPFAFPVATVQYAFEAYPAITPFENEAGLPMGPFSIPAE